MTSILLIEYLFIKAVNNTSIFEEIAAGQPLVTYGFVIF